MSQIASFFKTIFDALMALTTEQIALISVIVSLVLYLIGKRYDIKLKKYDAKKEHYTKFVNMFAEIMRHAKEKDDGWMQDKAIQENFYNAGSSLAIYGSRKMYRLYVLSRSLDNNPLINSSKYFDREIVVYIFGKIFRLMRKEIGLNGYDTINTNEILAFFINNIGCNPIQDKKRHVMEYKLRMIKTELFFINVISFVHASAIFNTFIRPIFGIIYLILKYILIFPLGKLFSILGRDRKSSTSVESGE